MDLIIVDKFDKTLQLNFNEKKSYNNKEKKFELKDRKYLIQNMSEKSFDIIIFSKLKLVNDFKTIPLSNINNIKSNYYLFYGENQGLKTEAIDIIKKSGFAENVLDMKKVKF